MPTFQPELASKYEESILRMAEKEKDTLISWGCTTEARRIQYIRDLYALTSYWLECYFEELEARNMKAAESLDKS